MAPLDIAKFNALLHSKEEHSELISVLRELTSVDVDNFSAPVAFWYFW